MIVRLTEEELVQMASSAALNDRTASLEEALLVFGTRVQDELDRRETILNRRMGCANARGHVFAIDGDGVKEMEYSSGESLVKWDGHGKCTNCDAVLGVTYREKI